MTTDPTFVDELTGALRALLDVHDRTCQARRERDAGFGTREAATAAAAAADAAAVYATDATADDAADAAATAADATRRETIVSRLALIRTLCSVGRVAA